MEEKHLLQSYGRTVSNILWNPNVILMEGSDINFEGKNGTFVQQSSQVLKQTGSH